LDGSVYNGWLSGSGSLCVALSCYGWLWVTRSLKMGTFPADLPLHSRTLHCIIFQVGTLCYKGHFVVAVQSAA